MSEYGFNTDPNAAAEISRAFFGRIAEKKGERTAAERKRREDLITQFDEIYDNKAGDWDDPERFKALQYANQLRQTLHEPKVDKAFQLDKEGRVPALVDVMYRKVLKKGPTSPTEPKEPQDPTKGGTRPGATGAPSPGTAAVLPAGLPALPGGDQPAAGLVSPAPAVPLVSGASTAPAVPEVPQYEEQPTMLTAQDRARRDRELSDIRTAIDPETAAALGLPEGVNINAQTASLFRGAADRKAKMLLKGLDENGDPLPAEKLPPEIAIKVRGEAAAQELMAAKIRLVQAQADGEPVKIQLARQQVAIAQQKADAYATQVATNAALVNSLGGNGGGMVGADANGAQNLFGSGPINDPVDATLEMLATGQISYGEALNTFSGKLSGLRPQLAARAAAKNIIIMDEKLRTKLSQFNSAKEATDTIYDAIEDYIKADGGIKKGLALHWLTRSSKGLSAIVGRAVGEKGAFSDRDQARFQALMQPHVLVQLFDPKEAQIWVRKVEDIFEEVESRELAGAYSRAYQTKGGQVKTLKPGDRTNVTYESPAIVPEVPKGSGGKGNKGKTITDPNELRKKRLGLIP